MSLEEPNNFEENLSERRVWDVWFVTRVHAKNEEEATTIAIEKAHDDLRRDWVDKIEDCGTVD